MTIPIDQRVPNRRLKAARMELRMSQSEFAAAVRRAGAMLGEPNDCNKRLVQKWESGEHGDCRPRYQRALQFVTRTAFAELGFSHTAAMPTVVASSPAVPLPAAPRADAPVTAPAPPVVAGLALEPVDRLRFALECPGQADRETVRAAQMEMERLFGLEQHRPASSIREAADRHTVEVARLLAGTRSAPLRRRLASIGGASAALAGWLALECGDSAAAHRAWDGALAAANHASDRPLMACVLGYLSYSAAERGDAGLAWQQVHTATEHAGNDVRMRAWTAARSAQEAARLGETTAALTAVESVRRLGWSLTAARPDEHAAPWVRFVDGACLAAMVAGAYGDLGEVRLALDAARHAWSVLGGGWSKARALVLAEIAHAAARADEFELVEQTAFEAVDLAESLDAVLARRKLRGVIAALREHPAPTGRQLAQKLSGQLDPWEGGAERRM